ncbi:acyl-CoA thioesterase [Bacillaceae bacterium SIJ1]|uniref:acyl-CoA thioesterase n=1 Tax=Litoribacterium kuwaitense TaxID=1398745 RepID=UPI0013EAF159|nr:acyl-CoA thioesterase [Litoribacterium kuwaitense]NGP45889.1 acyl-CoA thioesterase [Litoribacterium kuwaitense]
MQNRPVKACSDSRVVKTVRIFPIDTNSHGTMFGGKLLSYMDEVSSMSASRHSRGDAVTASMDSVDFLSPIRLDDAVTIESYVTWVGTSSMEVFIKVTAEDLKTGVSRLANTAFLTFVALSDDGRKKVVPLIRPESDEEKMLYQAAEKRAGQRIERRQESRAFANTLAASIK